MSTMFNPFYSNRLLSIVRSPFRQAFVVISGFVLLTAGAFSSAQQIRIDFVHQFEAKVVDMAVGSDGYIYLLNNDASVTLIDTLNVKRTLYLSEQGERYGLGRARCLAVDGKKRIFLGDAENGRVLQFDRKGQFIRQFGPSRDDERNLSEPSGISLDVFGRLFVTDEKGAVFVFNEQGVFMKKLTGFGRPLDIGVDRLGNVYVLESKEPSIPVFDPDLDLLTILRPGDDIRFVLSSPGGMFVEGDGTVYVTDREKCAVYILRAALEPKSSVTYYTQIGVKGEGRGEFRNPVAVAADGRGYLYIADEKNRNVQIFSMFGLSEIKKDLVLPSQQSLPVIVEWITDIDHSHASNSHGLQSFTLDTEGNMYILDSEFNSVSMYTWAGSYAMSFGREGEDPGRLKKPTGIIWDESKFLYIVDTGNNRIQQWSDSGVFQRQFGKKGKGPLEFNDPRAIARDRQGNLYVADKNNGRIQMMNPGGEFTGVLPGNGALQKPIGVALGREGRIYIIEEREQTITLFEQNGRRLSTIGDEERGPFQEPISAAVDSLGTLYILDARTGIHVFDHDQNHLLSFGSPGDCIGQFHQPTFIQIGPDNKVYVSDSEHNRISIFRLTNRSEGAVSGFVQPAPEQGRASLLRRGQSSAFDSLSSDGTFLLRNVSPGEYTIRIEASGYAQCSPETVHVVPNSVVRSGMIALEENGSIVGVLIPSVAQARLRLRKDLKYVAETKANPKDGRFAFPDVRPDEYEIEVQAEGYVSRESLRKIQVKSGCVMNDTISIKRPGSIAGVVTPPDVGALVSIQRDSVEITRVAVRSDNGSFETTGLYPGRYSLYVQAQDYFNQTVNDLDIGEGFKLDVGVIALQRMRITTPHAQYLIEEGKRLHLSAEFEQAQAFLLEAITTQEMADQDLAEAYLWLAYAYFPFPEQASEKEDALRKSARLDPTRMLDESFSPEFRKDFEAAKERALLEQED